jgi:hypothetical protein
MHCGPFFVQLNIDQPPCQFVRSSKVKPLQCSHEYGRTQTGSQIHHRRNVAEGLRLVREFLAFVTSRDTNAATRELLAIPGFQRSFVRGVKDIKAHLVKPWRQVRNDV